MPKPETDPLALFLSHRSALIDYAAPIVGCRAGAEDVVQEAYIRFTAASRTDTVAQPLGYLRRVVRNLALDLVRSPAHRRAGADGPAQVETRTPEEAVIYRNELRIVAAALDELPERTRTAFVMHRVDGHTLQDVASHLKVSVVRAHQLVREAILHVADRLEQGGG